MNVSSDFFQEISGCFFEYFFMNNFPANFANAGQLKFRPEIESFVLYGVF